MYTICSIYIFAENSPKEVKIIIGSFQKYVLCMITIFIYLFGSVDGNASFAYELGFIFK